MLTEMWSLEEEPRQSSWSSVASFGEWCHKDEGDTSQSQRQTKQTNPLSGILGFLGRRFLDSFDGEEPICLSCPAKEKSTCVQTADSSNGGHRVRDSFASLGSRDSSRSLHGQMSSWKETQEDGWIKLDLFVTDDAVDVELSILVGKMKQLYLMERARDAEFLVRYNGMPLNKTKRETTKISKRSQNDVPSHHEGLSAVENDQSFPTHRRHSDAKVSGFVKSLSMTTLAMSGAFEPTDTAKEEAEGYNVDGHCLQHIVAKTLVSDPSSSDFGCVRPREHPVSAAPKIKKGLHQSIKAKWQPVSRALSRCYSWDGCSSSDSSSRYGLSVPCGFIKRFVCCSSNLSSDDDDILVY